MCGALATSAPVRALLEFEAERTRALYREAAPGVAILHPTSRDAIACATVLYGGILEQVREAGYDVLGRRVSVPMRRRAAVAGPALVRARRARRRQPV